MPVTVTDPFLYERLSQPIDKFEAMQHRQHKSVALLHMMQNDEGVKSNCSFQPNSIAASGNHKSSSPPVVSRMDQAYLFNRLHKDGEKRLIHKAQMEQIRDIQETEKCTFKPEVNAESKRSKRRSPMNSERNTVSQVNRHE